MRLEGKTFKIRVVVRVEEYLLVCRRVDLEHKNEETLREWFFVGGGGVGHH